MRRFCKDVATALIARAIQSESPLSESPLSGVALAPWLLKIGLTPMNQGTYVPRSE